MQNSTWIWVALVIIVVAGLGFWFMNMDSAPIDQGASSTVNGATTTTNGTGTNVDVNVGVNTAPMNATVTYNGTGFSPSSVTIKKGGTVTWKNASSGNMWVASANHPTHVVYDGNTRSEHCASGYTGAKPFDQCVGGGDYSFTFTKAGTHGYHDHINASASGSVVVVE